MVSIDVNDAQLFEPKLKEVAARGVIVRLILREFAGVVSACTHVEITVSY